MGAAGHGDDAVHLGPEHHVVAGLGGGHTPGGVAALIDRNVHPQIERARAFGHGQADVAQGGEQVVGAVVVVLGAAEQAVAVVVAGRHQGVVDAGRGVLGEMQNRPPPVADQIIAGVREDAREGRADMLHGHELARVLGAERPGVDHLGTMGVDDLDRLTLAQPRGAAARRRNCEEFALLGHGCLLPFAAPVRSSPDARPGAWQAR